jgi:hypothetical protein
LLCRASAKDMLDVVSSRRRSNCQTKKLKSGYGPHWGHGTKTNWPTGSRSQCNLKLNLRHCTENYRPVLSSERAPYMKIKKVIVTQINITYVHLLQKGQDTRTNWPTDRRSYCDFDFDSYWIRSYWNVSLSKLIPFCTNLRHLETCLGISTLKITALPVWLKCCKFRQTFKGLWCR